MTAYQGLPKHRRISWLFKVALNLQIEKIRNAAGNRYFCHLEKREC